MGNMRGPFIVRATFVYNLYPVTDNPLVKVDRKPPNFNQGI